MLKLILIFFLIVFWGFLFGQDLQPYEAEELFNKKYYTAVWKYYRDKLKVDSLNSEFNYKMGVCYLNSRSQKDKAIHYLKRAAANKGNKSIHVALAYRQLGDANYMIANFDNAIAYYEKYQLLAKGNPDLNNQQDLTREIEMCKIAKELQELKDITSKLISQNGISKRDKAQTGFERTGYSISNSSTAFQPKKLKLKSDLYDADLFEENTKGNNKTVKPSVKALDSSKTKMETTVASSVDGQIILIYRDENGEANLYTSVLNGNDWMEPEKINRPIHNKSWESDEFISLDGSELYFASKRPGGFGGKDIYKCTKLPNGDWGKAKNLGPTINSSFDEEAPFVFPDGVTLYYSSNRFRTKGGFDHFTSSFTDSLGWTVPVNIGYPLHEAINSASHLATQTDTTFKKNNYISTFVSPKNTPVNIIKGKIDNTNDDHLPASIEITITDNETKEVSCVYRPDSKTGKYSCMVPSGKNNNITFEAKGYLFHSENINVPKDQRYFKLQQPVTMKQIVDGSKTFLNNVFFEPGTSTLSGTSEIELNRIYHLLKDNPEMRVRLSCSIKRRSTEEEIQLTEAKIQSVINYLSERGIDRSNIEHTLIKLKKTKNSENISQTNSFEKLELTILAKK
jgi:tetratricopeptide (TPR) repeat protein/outer membrane protein OmpA-like peptidoglycan-associated protein